MTVSRRAKEIQPFYVMEAVRAARALEASGRRVLHLEVGQPSTPAPKAVREAAHYAIDNNEIGYTMPQGLAELRQQITNWYETRYDINVPQERILITPGASGSCAVAFLGLFDPGDRVGVIEPGYPCYRNDLAVLGMDVVNISVGPETGYRPTPEILDQYGPLHGLVLASPSNPTGTVLDRTQLGDLIDWAGQAGTHLVVDEIYHGITYPASESVTGFSQTAASVTALAFGPASELLTVFNSFSKFWSMTGWRLGWIVAPLDAVQGFERVMANLLISASTVSQHAAIAAFDCLAECEANVERYRSNREILIEGLASLGIDKIAPPDGAFYVWADVGHLLGPTIPDTQELCHRWLNDVGLAVAPGIDFDVSNGDRFVRFSYAGLGTEMEEAIRMLSSWLT